MANRESTSFAVMDQTALWLKLRGEERDITCAEELEDSKVLRGYKRKLRAASVHESMQLTHELAEVNSKNATFRDEQVAQYATAGDEAHSREHLRRRGLVQARH